MSVFLINCLAIVFSFVLVYLIHILFRIEEQFRTWREDNNEMTITVDITTILVLITIALGIGGLYLGELVIILNSTVLISLGIGVLIGRVLGLYDIKLERKCQNTQ